jgi:type 1 glutamine amidotransferase
MILHGAITVQNNSVKFSKMVGGSFDYHPKQQEMHLKEVNANHPLVQAFKGKGFTHVDEPYFFNNAYSDYNFRPLLYIEADKLEGVKKEVSDNTIYVAWIKRHGKGRVFYSSPSHNAQSMDNPELLQFFLDGMQYVVGDLKCDDSPIGKP